MRTSLGKCPTTSGTRSRSTILRAPPAIPRAWSITTAALISSPSAMCSPAAWASIASISGNGWCFPGTFAVVGGPLVCLRQVRAPGMYDAIARHEVTHLCGAPIVMATLLNAPANEKKPLPHVVEFFTAAAPPPEAVLAAMKAAGFNVTHLYGLTETYG